MIDRTQRQQSTHPLPKSATTPVKAVPGPEGPRMAEDSVNVFSTDHAGRAAYDVLANAGAGAEVARDLRGIGAVVQQAGGKLPLLGGLSTRLSRLLDGVADWGVAVGSRMPRAASAFGKLAKAAPLLGVGVAMLDIGRAVIEQNPAKKQVAQGQAVLSAVGGLAGVIGAGAAVGATAFGLALAPLAVPAVVIGVAATAVSLADSFWLGGAISKGIARGLASVGSAIRGS